MNYSNVVALHQLWQWYITEGGGDMRHAASWELCVAICSVMESLSPRTIVDTGSGLTSIVVQLYARGRSDVECWHLDDDPTWAENTANALRHHKLDPLCVRAWRPLDRPVDLVIHDLGNPATRVASMDNVCHWGRVVIADDMHFDEVRHAALRTGRKWGELKATRDGYGRYAAISTPMVVMP